MEALEAFAGVAVAQALALDFVGVGATVALLACVALSTAEALFAGDAEAAPEGLPGSGEARLIGDMVCRAVGVCGCTVVTSSNTRRTRGNVIMGNAISEGWVKTAAHACLFERHFSPS